MQVVSPSNFNKFTPVPSSGAAYYWESSPSALLPPGFSLTRASANGTYFDSAGLLQTAAANAARGTYRYNGSAWVFDGTIVEAAATQLVTPTASIRDLTNAAWTKANMTTAKTSVGADGAANSATRCTATAGNATVLQTLVAAASSRTVSFLIRRVTGTGNIELTQDGATYTNIATQLNSSVYTLVQLNATQLNASFGIRIVTSGDAIDVDFAQFEAGGGATSRIATAGATRSADVPTASTSGLLINGQGFVAMRFRAIDTGLAATPRALIGSSGNLEGQPLYFSSNTSPAQLAVFDGSAANLFGTNTQQPAVGEVCSVATTWINTTSNGAKNGVLGTAAGFDGSMSLGATLQIGNAFANAWPYSFVLQSLRLGQVAQSSGQLATMTV